MLDTEPTGAAPAGETPAAAHTDTTATPAGAPQEIPAARPTRRRAARRPADGSEPADAAASSPPADETEPAPPRARSRRRSTAAATETTPATPPGPTAAEAGAPAADDGPGDASPAPKARRSRARKAASGESAAPSDPGATEGDHSPAAVTGHAASDGPATAVEPSEPGSRVRRPPVVTFIAPEPTVVPPVGRATRRGAEPKDAEPAAEQDTAERDRPSGTDAADTGDTPRRRRGRRGRGRGRGDGEGDAEGSREDGPPAEGESASGDPAEPSADTGDDTEPDDAASGGTRRRRRRRRRGSGGDDTDLAPDDPPATVVRVRDVPRGADKGAGREQSSDDEVQGLKGSTRLEAKRQRRRESRETSRRRPPMLTEAEFLARREAVERVMVVRQTGERTQIAVLEDGVLVEHYVTKETSASYAGNVYLGKVQNVLPSMEAAFVDIGKGRNAVLYAGEVNWDIAGLEGRPRKIESALKSGDAVLVQVTKDPIGHKGARLTSQISLPGRFLVYVPEGQMTGISRKLPDTERKRLKDILKRIVPEDAGVIIRTASEGASEAELAADVARLEAQWQAIKEKARKVSPPALLNAEPDLLVRVIRDLFNEDFSSLVVQGDQAWTVVDRYVREVSPDLAERLTKHTGETDVFGKYRIDEQIVKALDRKVWLPSGGSLVIDRAEAMTVIDVNTGKFTGQGGNLEETVTRNNLEAAEEIVRQLRLRDIGGIIVIDFIDMVLEANRDLVLRRLTECLGRDRTKHQVAEVTSLGLVQMTRKRVGQGLLEAFSEPCEACRGRGLIIHSEPVTKPAGNGSAPEGKGRKRSRGRSGDDAVESVDGGRRNGADTAAVVSTLATIHAASTEPAEGGERDSGEPVRVSRPAAAVVDPAPGPLAGAGDPDGKVAGLDGVEAPVTRRRSRRAASRPAGPPVAEVSGTPAAETAGAPTG